MTRIRSAKHAVRKAALDGITASANAALASQSAFANGDWLPAPYQVFAELTEGPHKGYRWHVKPAYRLNTLADAERAVKEDLADRIRPESFGGLINWGTMTPCAYAIFETNPKRVPAELLNLIR